MTSYAAATLRRCRLLALPGGPAAELLSSRRLPRAVAGKPFVVREAERPFSNLEYTGIDRGRVEGVEARLKADVLAEARGGAGCPGARGAAGLRGGGRGGAPGGPTCWQRCSGCVGAAW